MSVQIKLAQRDRFSEMARHMSRWVDQLLTVNYHSYRPEEVWSPSVNLYESETHYCVVVDLAGVNDAQVHLDGNILTIAGHRDRPGLAEPDAKTKRVHLMEIDHGPFARRIELPADVGADAIPPARHQKGILWIRLPKRKPAQ